MTLLICRTCPRDNTRHSGEFAAHFREALTKVAVDPPDLTLAIRMVQCLGGCPAHGVVALDAPCKTRVRFTGLDESDAVHVVGAVIAYEQAADGHPDHWAIPERLEPHLSSVTPKRSFIA
jgi:predicted metal-binding protein